MVAQFNPRATTVTQKEQLRVLGVVPGTFHATFARNFISFIYNSQFNVNLGSERTSLSHTLHAGHGTLYNIVHQGQPTGNP